MKIALIGYGKMGKMIEEVALDRSHLISSIIDSENWHISQLEDCDIAIDFSVPNAAVENIYKCINNNVPIVVGTTGWYESWENVKNEVILKNGSILTATNFSIGVNIFFEINKKLASLMNNQTSYSSMIQETHHTEKIDSPSGTAISIAEQMIQNIDRYKNWKESNNVDSQTLKIIAKREKDVPGTHHVVYKNDIDEISIEHKAINRKGFALGAVIAAEFLVDKKGVFNMNDVLKF
ncbi:MAG: 4-hydroxy-tetrahydrodipicolinate reductase [Crocinitomicaceae bacterium]|nr:4-hydroxy-tetrahydrodipicolinate reductase [Crocinitomicaceae bacterium]|tara:strand:+ start:3651 stop:4358 length:708 start_codon:yes stop_codon:yes gene_type:complete